MISTPPNLAATDGRATAGNARSPVWSAVAEHLGCDPASLPTLTERVEGWDHVNLQVALDRYLAEPGRSSRMLGAAVPMPTGGALFPPEPPDFANLLRLPTAHLGAVDRVDKPTGPDTTLSCIRSGLLLVSGDDGPLAAWVRIDSPQLGRKVAIDVKAPTLAKAQSFLDELLASMEHHNVYRGQVVRFTRSMQGNIDPVFEPRPQVVRDEVVLPPAALDAIDDHAVAVAAAADELRAAKRHLKRGLLLYGPPGTGKTLTTRYLVSRLPEATVFYMAGSSMSWLTFVAGMAAKLAPAIIVLDDVDLVAEDRDLGGLSPRRHLFDLLDAMDGIHEDADLLFVCTTNRPEALEKAIAARPGRVDLAVEVGLPDGDCRRRLIERYAEGLDLTATDLDTVVARTEGVTASFIKELLRRAALEAIVRAPEGDRVAVDDRALTVALDSLLDPLTSLRPITGATSHGGAA